MMTEPTVVEPTAPPVCSFTNEGRTVVVRTDLKLSLSRPTQVTEGIWVHGWFVRIDTSLYTPDEEMRFYLDRPDCFRKQEEITLAVANLEYIVGLPEWKEIPWIWQHRYRAVLEQGRPQLIPLEGESTRPDPTHEDVTPCVHGFDDPYFLLVG